MTGPPVTSMKTNFRACGPGRPTTGERSRAGGRASPRRSPHLVAGVNDKVSTGRREFDFRPPPSLGSVLIRGARLPAPPDQNENVAGCCTPVAGNVTPLIPDYQRCNGCYTLSDFIYVLPILCVFASHPASRLHPPPVTTPPFVVNPAAIYRDIYIELT
jgi:hypothetical protein